MKKIFSLLSIILLGILCLCSCGQSITRDNYQDTGQLIFDGTEQIEIYQNQTINYCKKVRVTYITDDVVEYQNYSSPIYVFSLYIQNYVYEYTSLVIKLIQYNNYFKITYNDYSYNYNNGTSALEIKTKTISNSIAGYVIQD